MSIGKGGGRDVGCAGSKDNVWMIGYTPRLRACAWHLTRRTLQHHRLWTVTSGIPATPFIVSTHSLDRPGVSLSSLPSFAASADRWAALLSSTSTPARSMDIARSLSLPHVFFHWQNHLHSLLSPSKLVDARLLSPSLLRASHRHRRHIRSRIDERRMRSLPSHSVYFLHCGSFHRHYISSCLEHCPTLSHTDCLSKQASERSTT